MYSIIFQFCLFQNQFPDHRFIKHALIEMAAAASSSVLAEEIKEYEKRVNGLAAASGSKLFQEIDNFFNFLAHTEEFLKNDRHRMLIKSQIIPFVEWRPQLKSSSDFQAFCEKLSSIEGKMPAECELIQPKGGRRRKTRSKRRASRRRRQI